MSEECPIEHSFPAESYQESYINWHRSPGNAVLATLVPYTPMYDLSFCIKELKYNKMKIVFYAVFVSALHL